MKNTTQIFKQNYVGYVHKDFKQVIYFSAFFTHACSFSSEQ